MKVSDLIDKLKKFDLNHDVVIINDCQIGFEPEIEVEEMYQEKDNDKYHYDDYDHQSKLKTVVVLK